MDPQPASNNDRDDQDDQTLVKPPPPPLAGTRAQSLPMGLRLGEFELKGYIGEGGLSIVYLAWDHTLERQVALKEYMPYSLARREGATHVAPRSEDHRDSFDIGLRSFINEAKLLARFEHRSLVKVYRFWEAHGTAYMVMPFYEGLTIKQTIKALGRAPNEAWLCALLDPITQALQVMHDERCYHRDIAPDNILLLKDTQLPVLLDFGAARRVVGETSQQLTVILKPGYAPIEQYAQVPGLSQGSWTDVYALAATVHWAITGKTPPAAVGRIVEDTYVPLATSVTGPYRPAFLQAIDQALTVHPDKRTRDLAAFRRALGLDQPDNATLPAVASLRSGTTEAPVDIPLTRTPTEADLHTASTAALVRSTPAAAPSAAEVPGTLPRLNSVLMSGVTPPPRPANRPSPVVAPEASRAAVRSSPSVAPAPARGPWILGTGVVAAGLAAGLLWWNTSGGGDAAAPNAQIAVPEPAVPVLTTAPPPSPAPSPAASPVAPEAAPPPVVKDAAPPSVVVAPTVPPSRSVAVDVPAPAPAPSARERTPAAPPAEPSKPRVTAATPAKPERSDNAEQCARLFQRASLGETSSELLEQMRRLNCK